MAFIIDPKQIGSKIKVAGHGQVIEVNEANRELLLSLGQTQFFKHKKDKKKDVSNNEGNDKPTVYKRKRKSDVK
jgi:hypothetical protein